MSTFSGLNRATTALWAQQRGLDVTGQNIANINTIGYSRQRVELQSVNGNAVPAMYAVSNQVGQGVDADTVIRIRDAFLEGRAQAETATTAQMTVRDDTLAQVEQAFREPGTTGISAKLTSVYTSWSELASSTKEDGARAAVLQNTATLVAELHTTSATLDRQWTQTRDSLDVLAQDVNAKAQSIADLNESIKRANQAGLPINELADKRDVLVMDLAEAIGATSTPGEDGQVDVLVSGSTLISGGTPRKLTVVGTDDPATATSTDPRFVTAPGNVPLAVGGTAGGKLTALTDTIPRYRAKLDEVAQQVAKEINGAHVTGFDKNGIPGEPVFDGGPGSSTVGPTGVTVDLTKITAATINLRIDDTAKLAAASVAPLAGAGPSSDNGNATALGKLKDLAAGSTTVYRKLIVTLGVEASVATSNLETQKVIASQVDASRESVAGVNLDEEMTNMLQFQHAYSAAARMITAIDETLDVLINRTGRVGL